MGGVRGVGEREEGGWGVRSYVCMYVCMYAHVCMYTYVLYVCSMHGACACLYVCMYDCM